MILDGCSYYVLIWEMAMMCLEFKAIFPIEAVILGYPPLTVDLWDYQIMALVTANVVPVVNRTLGQFGFQ